MTSNAVTPTTTTDADASTPATAAPGVDAPSGPVQMRPSVVEYDPATLLVDVNIRRNPRLDKAFVDSIRDLGVQQPVIAVRTTHGDVRVKYGHRRVLAAIEVGRTVPVIVVADEATDDAATIDRILGQWAENEHRTGLTTSEKVGAVEQLALLGVSAARIARGTKLKRKQVDAAIAASKSDLAKAALDRYEFLTLDQSQAIAEFEDDPETVKALIAAAKSGQFDHVAQRARDDRADREAKAVAEAALTEQGVTLVDRPTGNGTIRLLAHLTNDDQAREPITPDEHANCPGHAAYLMEQWVPHEDPTPENNDGDDEDREDDEAAHGNAPAGSYQWLPQFVCTDPGTHGHQPRFTTSPSAHGRTKVADMSEEDREEARRVRREVIDNNKAWESAQTVRREWLRTFAGRSKAPKGTAVFLAAVTVHDADMLTDLNGDRLYADLLGVTSPEYGRSTDVTDLIAKANDTRAQVIHLVIVLSCYEARTSREDWRTPNHRTRRYLTHLETLGYPLSDVERRALGQHTENNTDNDTDTENDTENETENAGEPDADAPENSPEDAG